MLSLLSPPENEHLGKGNTSIKQNVCTCTYTQIYIYMHVVEHVCV